MGDDAKIFDHATARNQRRGACVPCFVIFKAVGHHMCIGLEQGRYKIERKKLKNRMLSLRLERRANSNIAESETTKYEVFTTRPLGI